MWHNVKARVGRAVRKYRLRTIHRSPVGLIAVTVMLLGGGALLQASLVKAAGTATLSLSPASQTVAIGGTVEFDIVANVTSDTTNAIQANLSYDDAIFDSGTVECGTALSLEAEATVASGNIDLACALAVSGNPPVPTGTFVVGTVTLHAASGGTDPIAFRVSGDTESAVASVSSPGVNILTSTTGGSYTVGTAPSVSITAPAASAAVRGTINVTADASDDVGVLGVQFKVDGSNIGSEDTNPPYSVSWDTTGVSDGSHSLTAVARDATTPTTTSSAVSVTVDNTPPNTTINSTAIGSTQSSSATFTFSSNEGGSTFQCQIDGGGYSTCASPRNYTGLANGSHTFMVRAIDAAGNTDASPASETWSISDLTAPSVPGKPTTSSATTDNTPTWTWSASTDNTGVDHYEVQWCGNSGFTSCDSNVADAASATYTHTVGLADGSWYFRVRAHDAADNNSAYSVASDAKLIDATAPNTTITSSAISSTQSRSASFTFTSSEGSSTFACQIDAGSYGACTSPQSYSNLSLGSHTFNVRATDAAGNTDASPASETWTITDTTAPTVPGTPSTTTPTTDTTPTWTWTASTDTFGVDHYEVQWCLASNFSGCNANVASLSGTTYTHTADLTVGTWYFRVRAVDAVPNISAYSSNGTVVINEPPLTISNLSITPSGTGAAVTWTTNFASSTQLEYGIGVAGSGFSATTTETDTGGGVTSHSANMPTLVPCATYHLRALSDDSIPRSAQSADTQFATTGCPGGATVTGAQSAAITFGSGGSLNYNDGDGEVNLTIPANASSANLVYQVQRLTVAGLSPVAAPTGLKAVADRVYQMQALENVSTLDNTFDQPITVRMGYTQAMADKFKPETLKLFSRDSGAWEELSGCTVDTTAKTVTCTTTHFSSFSIFGEEASAIQQALNGLLPEVGAGWLGVMLASGGAVATALRLQRRRDRK